MPLHHIISRGTATLLLVSAFIPVFCQTYNTDYGQTGDKIVKYQINLMDAGPSRDSVVWNLEEIDVGRKKTVQTFRMSEDSISTIVATERAYVMSLYKGKDGLYEKQSEDKMQKTIYSEPALFLPAVFGYGYMRFGYLKGVGLYSDRLYTVNSGNWNLACDARGTIVTPEGVSIRNVLRLHSTRNVTTHFYIYSKSDSLSKTTKDDGRHVLSTSHTILERYMWFAPEYRYPILEMQSLRSADSDSWAHLAYYTPIDILESYKNTSYGMNIQNIDIHAKDIVRNEEKDFAYQMSNNADISKITVHYTAEKPCSVTAILADIRGIVYLSVSLVSR